MPATGRGPEPEWLVDAAPADAVATTTDRPAPPVVGGAHRRSRPTILGVARGRLLVSVAVAACLIAGGAIWWTTRGGPPLPVTVKGATVAHAQTTLRSAEANFHSYARTERGATEHSSRCYFERAGSATTTDVTATLYCGPVLFFGGSPTAPYLTYQLTSKQVGSAVVLTPAPQPGAAPVAAPGAWLMRPDRHRPPAGAVTLTPPVPPPAPATLLAEEPYDSVPSRDVSMAPAAALMGSRDATVTLESSGFVPYVGTVGHARSAPPDMRLLAFQLEIDWSQNVSLDTNKLSLAVSIDNAAPRPLSLSGATLSGQWFAAAVPRTVHDVALVFADAGFTQRLSLISGLPSPGNIRILGGHTDLVPLSAHGSATADVHASTEFLAHLSVAVTSAQLSFFLPGGEHPARADHAFLTIDACFRSPDFVDSTTCHSFRGSDLTLSYPGHPAQQARLIPTSGGDYYGVFDVPWDLGRATVTVTGSEHAPPSDGEVWRMTIVSPVSFPIDLGHG